MKRIKTLLLVAVLAYAGLAAWKAGSCELQNLQLQQDMLDLSKQAGVYTNYSTLRSDDDFRDAVIHKAQDHEIRLDASQVVVRHTGSGGAAKMYLAATYTEPVDLPGLSFELHFHPTSENKLF